MKIDEHQNPDRFFLLGGILCMALLLSIILVNYTLDDQTAIQSVFGQSSAFSQSYDIWHDSTGYYVISQNGQARYPLHTTLLNVGYGCFKFQAQADLFTKTISITLTSQEAYLCLPMSSGGRH